MAQGVMAGTGLGLLEFLQWAGRRGELKPERATALLTGTRRLLEIDDEYLTMQAADIPVDTVIERFENLHRTDYSAESIKTYALRLRRSLGMYLAWLDKEPNWKGATAKAAAAKPASKASATKGSIRVPSSVSETSTSSAPVIFDGRDSEIGMAPYELPLRQLADGRVISARLVLPEILTKADAARIGAFVNSLAFDASPTAGTET